MFLLQADSLDVIRDNHPYFYIILVGLITTIGVLCTVIKIFYDKNDTLIKEKDDLHESKLKIALSSAESIKQALHLVENINNKVILLHEGRTEAKLAEQETRSSLHSLYQLVKEIQDEVRKNYGQR